MPLELGVFLGCKEIWYRRTAKEKNVSMLDTEPYRYQQFISDIAGQDIQAHSDTPETIVKVVTQLAPQCIET